MNKSHFLPGLVTLGLVLGLLLLLCSQAASGLAQPDDSGPDAGTVWVYQGRLERNGRPVDGECELLFRLYDSETGDIALGWHLAGILLFIIHWVLFIWAMACNPFFSESVRIQENHQVAQRGPYRLVRHPGYLGNLIGCLGHPLLLGSWWAFIPAILTIIAFIIRTALEDKTLQKELAGYPDYAGQVRFRLLPGIWQKRRSS